MHIFNHNFDETDLPYVLLNYDEYSAKCKTEITRLFLSHLATVIYREYPVAYNLLQEVMTSGAIDENNLFQLFSYSVEKFDLSQTRTCLTQLKQDALLNVFEGKHPKIPITTTNLRVLEAFRDKHWITSFNEEGNEYRVYGKKQ